MFIQDLVQMMTNNNTAIVNQLNAKNKNAFGQLTDKTNNRVLTKQQATDFFSKNGFAPTATTKTPDISKRILDLVYGF